MRCFRALPPLCAPSGGSDSPDLLLDFTSRGAPCSSPPVFSAAATRQLWHGPGSLAGSPQAESFPSEPMTGGYPALPGLVQHD